MTLASLFVIVPGFGRPHTLDKVRILESNLRLIKAAQWSQLCVRICVYDPEAILDIPTHLREDPCMEWVVHQGIVGEFLHAYAPPSTTSMFDYVMMILDDIELQNNMDFARLLRYHKTFAFDIFTPSLAQGSQYQFQYMLTRPDSAADLMLLNACEAFCYFMSSSSYEKYYTHIDPHENPWLWGLDMCMAKCLGLKACLLNRMTMIHHYKNECYALRPDRDPVQGYKTVMDKYGVTTEELAQLPAVQYYIIDQELLA